MNQGAPTDLLASSSTSCATEPATWSSVSRPRSTPKLELAEIHRRVIAAGGPAVLFRRTCEGRDSFPVVTNLFGTHRARRARVRNRGHLELIEQASPICPRSCMPPSLGKLWKRSADLFFGTRQASGSQAAEALGPVCDEVVTNAAEPHRACRRSKTWKRDGGGVRDAAARLHRASAGPAGREPRHVPHPGARRRATAGLHVQIGKGGGFHLAEAEAAGRAAPRERPRRRSAGRDPRRDRAAAGERPRGPARRASLARCRRLRCRDNPVGPLPAGRERRDVRLVGEVAPGARRPEGPVRRPLRLLLRDDTTIRCFSLQGAAARARTRSSPPRSSASRGRRTSSWATSCRSCSRRSCRSRCRPCATSGATARRATTRSPPASCANATSTRGDGQRLPHPRRGAAVSDEVPAAHGRPSICVTSAPTLTPRPRARRLPHRPVRVREPLDGLARLRGPRVNEGSKGVLLGTRRARARAPHRVHGTPRTTPCREGRGVLPRLPRRREARPSPRTQAAPDCRPCTRIAARSGVRATGRCFVLTDDADRSAAQERDELPVDDVHALRPAADLHAPRVELVHHASPSRRRVLIDARMKPTYPEELFCDEDTARDRGPGAGTSTSAARVAGWVDSNLARFLD